jgi:hypothetical protein
MDRKEVPILSRSRPVVPLVLTVFQSKQTAPYEGELSDVNTPVVPSQLPYAVTGTGCAWVKPCDSCSQL